MRKINKSRNKVFIEKKLVSNLKKKKKRKALREKVQNILRNMAERFVCPVHFIGMIIRVFTSRLVRDGEQLLRP